METNRWNLKWGFWLMLQGCEIPAWFENPDYVHLDPQLIDSVYNEEYAFFVSTIVDIPNNCLSSDWMGIAVCLSLESIVIHKHICCNPIFLWWSFKAPDTEIVYPLHFDTVRCTHFDGHHLYITIFGGDSGYFKTRVRGDQNKMQLMIYGVNRNKCGKLKLKNFGSRVLCKEDQAWHEAATAVDMPSASVDSSILKQSRITEIADDFESDEQKRKRVKSNTLCLLFLLFSLFLFHCYFNALGKFSISCVVQFECQ